MNYTEQDCKVYEATIEDLQTQLKNVRNFLVVCVNHEDMCESCQKEAKMLLEEM